MNMKEYPKVIRITPNKISKILQVLLGLEDVPLISIKKVKGYQNNAVSVLFNHDTVRYLYFESQTTIQLYRQIQLNEGKAYEMIYKEGKQ